MMSGQKGHVLLATDSGCLCLNTSGSVVLDLEKERVIWAKHNVRSTCGVWRWRGCRWSFPDIAANKLGGTCTGGVAAGNTVGTCSTTNAWCSAASGGTCGCATGSTANGLDTCGKLALRYVTLRIRFSILVTAFIHWRLIAPSSAEGDLRVFHWLTRYTSPVTNTSTHITYTTTNIKHILAYPK